MNLVFHLKEKFEKSWEKKDGCRRRDINNGVFINKRKIINSKNSGRGNIFVVSLVVILCHSLSLDTLLSFYKRSFLYCFINLKSLPIFFCSFLFMMGSRQK